MATTKKYLDEDGLVQYTGKVKKAIADGDAATLAAALTIIRAEEVTDIQGTTTAPTYANDVNASATQRSAGFTNGGSPDTFPYYDTIYGEATTTKDGLMTHEDKTKLNGIATGAEVNVQSDWNQTTTTADDYIKNKPDVNKVKLSTKSDNNDYPVLVSADSSFTSGTDHEAGYDADLKFNPSTNVLTVGTATITGTNDRGLFSGRAQKTETLLMQATASSKGSEMVGYQAGNGHNNEAFDNLVTVDDALDALIETVDDMSLDGGGVIVDVDGTNIDISSGDSLNDVVEAIDNKVGDIEEDITNLQDGGNLVQGTNITLTKDTTNHTVTIAAADEKVKHTTDTDTTSAIPMLFAGTTTNNDTAGVKFNNNVSFKPSTNEFKVSSTTTGSGGTSATHSVAIKDGIVTFADTGMTSVTISTAGFSGNAATATRATQDSEGNNIFNTYATKEALSELSQKWTGQFIVVKQTGDTAATYVALTNILDAIEAGQTPSASDLAVLEYGYIYLLKDTGASSPNVYDEYIKVKTGTTTESVEKVGTTDAGVDVVSLTPAEINTIWSTTAAAS